MYRRPKPATDQKVGVRVAPSALSSRKSSSRGVSWGVGCCWGGLSALFVIGFCNGLPRDRMVAGCRGPKWGFLTGIRWSCRSGFGMSAGDSLLTSAWGDWSFAGPHGCWAPRVQSSATPVAAIEVMQAFVGYTKAS